MTNTTFTKFLPQGLRQLFHLCLYCCFSNSAEHGDLRFQTATFANLCLTCFTSFCTKSYNFYNLFAR